MPTPTPPQQGLRFIDRDGRVLVPRVGVQRRPLSDLYFSLLHLPWRWLVPLLFSVYLLIVTLFALLYRLDPHGVGNARPDVFADYFFFSVHTLATIGYGTFSPQSLWAHLLVTIEAFVGLLAMAMLTGLTFAKFSRPTARVLFSHRGVVAALDGRPTLMVRMANGRDGNVVEANLRLTLVRDVRSAEGVAMRRFYDLPLLRSWTPIFALTWTVYHVIDEDSPLYGLGAADLTASHAELVVTLSGLDETLGQSIHARFSYTPDEIVWNARFVDVIEERPEGRRVNYARLHDVETYDEPPAG